MTTRRAFLVGGAFSTLAAAKKKKKKTPQEPLGVVGGTVFDSRGRSLPRAKLVVYEESAPKKRYRGVSDRRGEFAIRVPAGEGLKYRVRVEAKGFQPAERTTEVYEAQKTNLNFLLSRK